ncbi:MAG: hypothetical protein ABI656_08770 [bacterium]
MAPPDILQTVASTVIAPIGAGSVKRRHMGQFGIGTNNSPAVG